MREKAKAKIPRSANTTTPPPVKGRRSKYSGSVGREKFIYRDQDDRLHLLLFFIFTRIQPPHVVFQDIANQLRSR
jgi:hypothetical protein